MSSLHLNPEANDEMTCKVCKNEFKDPIFLSCLHSFCSDCLRGLVQDDVISCPTCQTQTEVADVEALPSNVFVSSILKSRQFQSSRSELHKICSNCDDDQDLSTVCKECRFFLCSFCTQAHKKQKSTRKHELVTVQEFMSSVESSSIFDPFNCEKHDGEVIKMFCTTCEEMLCRDCVIMSHRDHNVLEMTKAYEETKPEIQSLVQNVEEVVEMLESAISSIHQMESSLHSSVSIQTARINEVFEEMSRVLVKRKKELMDSIIEEENLKQETLKKQAKELKNTQETMSHASAFGKETLERDNPFEILTTKRFISDHLSKLIQEKGNFRLPENDEIVFRGKNIQKTLQFLNEIGEVKTITHSGKDYVNRLKLVDLCSSECRQTFKVVVYDKKGCATSGHISDDISVIVTEQGTKQRKTGEVHDNLDGTYTVTYPLRNPGQYQVTFMNGTSHVIGSPFHFIFRQF